MGGDHGLLGTDDLGRDVWARVCAGAGVSLAIAAVATVASLAIGMAIGIVAGATGGRIDGVLMRAVDLVLTFPALLLAILLAALLRETSLDGTSAPVVIALAAVGWTTTARVVRTQASAIARSDAVTAARALGASPWRIATRHVLPELRGHGDRAGRARLRGVTCSRRRRCHTSASALPHRPRPGAACCSRATPTTGPRRG